MVTNKIISIAIAVAGIIVIPAQIISTFVLGILVSLTFGLLLIPISLVWMVLFFGPLLALSYLYERVSVSKPFVSIVGIPLAVLGNTYVALMPSMGEIDSRFEKMIICQTFPYTWRYLQLLKGKDVIESGDILSKVLREISRAKPLKNYLDNLRADVISRPSYLKKNYRLDW